MRKLLVGALLAAAACAHSREQTSMAADREPAAQAVAPAQPAPAPSTASGGVQAAPALTAEQQRAREELAQARQRLDDARRELSAATSERTAAEAAQQHAQRQARDASQAIDSLAQARAAEATRAADQQRRLADTHTQYATQLVAARQAEVEAAQVHLRTTDAAAWASAHPGATAGERDAAQRRLTQARNEDAQARSRAEQLGEVALAAQRRWEAASHPAQGTTAGAGAPQPGTAATGLGSAAAPEPPASGDGVRQPSPPAAPPESAPGGQ